jgi:hypothetical protein
MWKGIVVMQENSFGHLSHVLLDITTESLLLLFFWTYTAFCIWSIYRIGYEISSLFFFSCVILIKA